MLGVQTLNVHFNSFQGIGSIALVATQEDLGFSAKQAGSHKANAKIVAMCSRQEDIWMYQCRPTEKVPGRNGVPGIRSLTRWTPSGNGRGRVPNQDATGILRLQWRHMKGQKQVPYGKSHTEKAVKCHERQSLMCRMRMYRRPILSTPRKRKG
jgi:hypothetical protein